MDFSSTLLREKFVIRDSQGGHADVPVIALSNRIVVTLQDSYGLTSEVFVVRSQTMHTCLRMAVKIAQTYARKGPIQARDPKFDFKEAWEDIVAGHETQFNETTWLAVYNSGRRVFHTHEYHAFLDVIENCEFKNRSGSYDASVVMAEKIFAEKGKTVSIEHETNTGMVLDLKKGRARCGLILRSPTRRTNFTYTAEQKSADDSSVTPARCMSVAAAFLEGIHLAFLIGRANERLRLGLTAKNSAESRKAAAARRRMSQLGTEIATFESMYAVRYRAARPEFPDIVAEAEKFTRVQYEYEEFQKEQGASQS